MDGDCVGFELDNAHIDLVKDPLIHTNLITIARFGIY